jgi:hypothetical protein
VTVTEFLDLLLRLAVETRVAVPGDALVVLPPDVGHEGEGNRSGADTAGDVERVSGAG